MFVNNLILAQSGGEYDPWLDLNDDGVIDVNDLQILALIYATSGIPINKTELLLELEARIDSLNASLLTDYYNITDCDSLFALLAHMHSGSDISGGTLAVDQIRLGSTEGNNIIYFYDGGSPTGEYIYWLDAGDQFYLSDDVTIWGTITIPTTTRYYSISAIAWLPYQDDYDFFRSTTAIYGFTAGVTYWSAPVNLPHGAVVTEFSVWVWDNDVATIDVRLFREAVVDQDLMASVNSLGASPSYQQLTDSSIDYASIDNQNYIYHVFGILRSGNSNHRLGKVHITYTIDEPLP